MADMGGKFVQAAIALILGVALLPTVAEFVDNGATASGVSSTQATVIRLVLTIFVLAMAYAIYSRMT